MFSSFELYETPKGWGLEWESGLGVWTSQEGTHRNLQGVLCGLGCVEKKVQVLMEGQGESRLGLREGQVRKIQRTPEADLRCHCLDHSSQGKPDCTGSREIYAGWERVQQGSLEMRHTWAPLVPGSSLKNSISGLQHNRHTLQRDPCLCPVVWIFTYSCPLNYGGVSRMESTGSLVEEDSEYHLCLWDQWLQFVLLTFLLY